MIKILPEMVSNKVAAGEVVERPASVVKELVENALDAGSTRIVIDVEKGGRALIRVADNGTGMNHDDALLSLERYATSKIFNDSDLFSIKTLGFRGEAVPSIASISRFYLITNEQNSDAGTSIFVDGGKIKKVSRVGAPAGTMVTVKQLFFNLPARRKFLKTINTEMSHIADIISKIALNHPDVNFKLSHNGKVVKNWSSVSDPADRITDVLCKNIKDNFYKVEYEQEKYKILGWISASADRKNTSRGIYIYVNSRFVRDRTIQHALFEGYSGRLLKGEFPSAILFIEAPHESVDVNVHPAKNEVRFLQQKVIHDAVVTAVSSTLGMAEQPNWKTAETCYNRTMPIPAGVSDPVVAYNNIQNKTEASDNIKTSSCFQKNLIPQQINFWEKKYFSDLKILGQLHNTYILCESDEGLILVDQHAAHERILFEQLKKMSESSINAAQQLLVPEVLDLGFREKIILEKIIPDLARAGLDIEPFGGDSFAVKAVPSIISDEDIKPLIIEIVESIAETGFSQGLSSKMNHCLMLMACHGSIRAKQSLAHEQIKGLLAQLDECDNPSRCPHGRPTWINWTTPSIEKAFKRIV